MNAAALLLVSTLSIPTNVLVLRSGERIDVVSTREENGRIVFVTPEGRLFSVAAAEVTGTEYAAPASQSAQTASAERNAPATAPAQKKLKATPDEQKRLIEAIEQNHAGVAAPPRPLEIAPPPPTLEEAAKKTEDEWSWRNRARIYEEAVRVAKENRDLLVDKAESLRSHIAGLISLGYKPGQFTYDTTMLAYTTEQIPQANLEVTRAERALAAFREEARQRGILPGWVR